MLDYLDTEQEKIIDIKKLPKNFEIPIEDLFDYEFNPNENSNKNKKQKPFNFEELNYKDSSSAIKYEQFGNNMMININGPKECKFRDKAKNDICIIEVYTKNCVETKKESNYII